MPAAWVAAIGAIAGAASQADAARKAAGEQGSASAASIAAQKEMYQQNRADNAQFLKTGNSANARLGQLLGLPGQVDPNDPKLKEIYDKYVSDWDTAHRTWDANNRGVSFDQGRSIFDAAVDPAMRQRTLDQFKDTATKEYVRQYGDPSRTAPDSGSLLKRFDATDLSNDPVYNSGLKFGLDQGTSAINARALATGNYDSGATLKALTRYGNDFGSTKANESYNRYNQDQTNIFNKLSGISGTGQVATAQVGSAGTSAANQMSADLTGAGNARAAGIVGQANAWGGAANNVSGAYNTYQNNQRYNALTNNSSNYTRSGTYDPYYSGTSSDGSYAYG